jgi:uncharacterized protein
MRFEGYEWDENKELSNLAKHGVSFGEAMTAVEDALEAETISSPFRSRGGETRYEAEGVSDFGRPLVVVFTLRSKNCRIISARRRA